MREEISLVEYNPFKVDVAGSNPASRSIFPIVWGCWELKRKLRLIESLAKPETGLDVATQKNGAKPLFLGKDERHG